MVLGGLVLLVATINYANVATAQATTRAKEVGMRKVVGARKSQVMFQYVLEAALLTVAALVIALAAVMAISPVFQNAIELDLTRALFDGLGFWAFLIGLIAVVALVLGLDRPVTDAPDVDSAVADLIAANELSDPGALLVSRPFLERHGLAVGDSLSLIVGARPERARDAAGVGQRRCPSGGG